MAMAGVPPSQQQAMMQRPPVGQPVPMVMSNPMYRGPAGPPGVGMGISVGMAVPVGFVTGPTPGPPAFPGQQSQHPPGAIQAAAANPMGLGMVAGGRRSLSGPPSQRPMMALAQPRSTPPGMPMAGAPQAMPMAPGLFSAPMGLARPAPPRPNAATVAINTNTNVSTGANANTSANANPSASASANLNPADAAIKEALIEGNAELIRQYLAAKLLHPNKPLTDGTLPFIAVCKRGHMRAAEVLFRAGANINMFDSKGWSPLHWAAATQNVQLASQLCQWGAQVTTSSPSNKTPLDLAWLRGCNDIVDLLLQYGHPVSMISTGTNIMPAPPMLNLPPARKRRSKEIKVQEDRRCAECGLTDTPQWRRGPNGPATLCNACGLKWIHMNNRDKKNARRREIYNLQKMAKLGATAGAGASSGGGGGMGAGAMETGQEGEGDMEGEDAWDGHHSDGSAEYPSPRGEGVPAGMGDFRLSG